MFKHVGSSDDRENSVRVQKHFSSPHPLENSMIEGSNQVQRGSNFVGTITKTLWTCPRKESMNYSMIWEESRNSRARTGFSQERKNFVSKELVNPRRLAQRKEQWIHLKELIEELRSRASWSHKWKPKIVTNKAQDVWDWNEIKSPERTRREGPPFPINSRTKSQESISKISP